MRSKGSGRILGVNQVKSLASLAQVNPEELGQPRKLLREYLLANQITVASFAMMVGFNRRVLDTLMRGGWTSKGGYIQLHQAFAIEWATQGKVPAYLWLTDEFNTRRIRESRMTSLKDFEDRIKSHVLKWNSLKTTDGAIRDKARVLARLFNVQWGEVKKRAWLDAERKAATERADISHLLEPEDKGPTDDGVYYHGEDHDYQLDHQEWFTKHFG